MALSVAQIAQMSALLDEALELDKGSRRQWLDRLGPEHRELEGALRQALLPQERDDAGSDRLATLPKLEAAGGRVGTLKPGERVGPYQLERALGSGGMAEVWLAQRADGAFKREVALKLPMLSGLRQDLASRFARERDILAGLEHPNIARLYDAGVTPEGLPYLAMEYVHGEPLTAWCDAHRLGIRERLKLFLQVLDAVQYAHGHHVVHRDIKPSNILVTDLGQVRLLDFGVAKLLAEEDEHTQLTQIYGRALTPDYASPELVRGDPIDATSDVYSLGVVLYELLAGSRPYHLKAGASVALLEQAIATAQVQRPSTQVGAEAGAARATSQQKLARRLRGDLDAIVLRALAKVPADRYASVSALADDLQRYLSGDPVEARYARPTYLIGKFVHRHRTRVATATAVAVLAAAMMIGYELVRSPGVQQRAAANAVGPAPNTSTVAVSDKSIAVLPFVDMSEKHDQEYFSDGLSEELIDRLSRSADLKVIARTSAFSFKGKNEDIRSIAAKLGVANLLEGSVRRDGNEMRITAQLIRASDGIHLWSQTYDRNVSGIFKVQEEIAGTVAEALKVALTAGAQLQASEANTEAYNLVLKGNYFFARGEKGDFDRAIKYFKKAIQSDAGYALPWASLGHVYIAQAVSGERPTSEVESEARVAVKRALAIDSNSAEAHYALAKIYRSFDWDWTAAKFEYERAISLDPNIRRGYDPRGSLLGLAAVQSGELDELISHDLRRRDRDPLDARTLAYLGGDQFFAGHLEDSAATYEKLLELYPGRVFVRAAYGRTLLFMGRYADALREAESESDEGSKLCVLSSVYWAMGRRTDSDEALARLKKKYARVAATNIAEIYAYRGDQDVAFEWLDRAYRQRDSEIQFIKGDPYLRNLRKDPRFRALLVKMNLTD